MEKQTEAQGPPSYFVIFMTTTYRSLDQVRAKAPDLLAAHLARSKELHAQGSLLMAGAFLDQPGEPIATMAVLTSKEAAEAYAKGDPFVVNGMVSEWSIRPWANLLG